MENKIFNKLFVCSCLILLCNSAAFCCWEEMTPIDYGAGYTWLNDGYIQWDKTTTGLSASLYLAPTSFGTISQSYHEAQEYVSSSRRIGYEWVDGIPQPATFVLSWGGSVESTCRSVAHNLDDYCRAEELARARVISSDFVGSNPFKWMVLSSKGAHCPANPPLNQEVEISDEDTIFVMTGIPAYTIGTMTWSDFASDRSFPRIVDGGEASTTTVVLPIPFIHSAIFNHTGYGDASNTVVDAIAHHDVIGDISFQCGNLSGRGIYSFVDSCAETILFDIDKL